MTENQGAFHSTNFFMDSNETGLRIGLLFFNPLKGLISRPRKDLTGLYDFFEGNL